MDVPPPVISDNGLKIMALANRSARTGCIQKINHVKNDIIFKNYSTLVVTLYVFFYRVLYEPV
jgi:hypothetical protein